MSGYRIVLNITGNANTKAEKLAMSLERASIASGRLAANLAAVGAESRSIRSLQRIGNSGGGGYVNPNNPHYTRHRYTRIASFGTGFNFGPFSGRLSSIFQPDANGNLMGMNAASLMKGVNIAGIVTTLLAKTAKIAMKVIAGTTLAPVAIGGIGMMGAIRALQSESFAEGVRLISRRHQARLGLGADFERGQTSADFLSKAYGLDRSTTLSSINVLSGMGVGGGSRKLTVGEATGLTKVGGLISQQSGVSFERVMTNIQQLLVQTAPHVRDIREMLNQAPILGKYALKDMEEQGVTGVDVRTWMKDQSHILSALKRYELDMASNAGMQARGQIALAQQDFWAKIASNDQFWRFVGMQGSGIIGSAGSGISNLMTTLANNDAFKVMAAYIETIFDKFSTKGVTFMDKLTDLIDGLSQRFGLGGSKTDARIKVGKRNAIEELMVDENFKTLVLGRATAAGLFKDHTSPTALAQAQQDYLMEAASALQKNPEFLKTITGENKLSRKVSLVDSWRGTNIWENLLINAAMNTGTTSRNKRAAFESIGAPSADSTFRYLSPDLEKAVVDKLKTPAGEYASYAINTVEAMRFIDAYLKEVTGTGTFNPGDFSGSTEGGKDLTGFNRDRRALEIHFNAPIVEWTNTMNTNSPQETVDAVAENIEEIASAAIQKALLGASNKMSTRWY